MRAMGASKSGDPTPRLNRPQDSAPHAPTGMSPSSKTAHRGGHVWSQNYEGKHDPSMMGFDARYTPHDVPHKNVRNLMICIISHSQQFILLTRPSAVTVIVFFLP